MGRTSEFNASFSEDSLSTQTIRSYVVKPGTVVSFNKDDDLIKKAFKCFEKAIEIAKENYPAILDLGILLKKTGQIKEALKQFNKVTNSHSSSIDHRLIVISAYEQAGLCYIELSKTATNDNSYEEEGKRKLTTAVSLAADLVVLMPELKDSAQKFWKAFRTLEDDIDRESPPSQYKNKINLLKLARDPEQIVEVIQKLQEYSEDELNDEDIITTALNSYLTLQQADNALAFQNLVGMNPDVRDSSWWTTGPLRDLRIKVLLQAVSRGLTSSTENPAVLYQQLFKLCFGKCCGISTHEDDEQLNQTGTIIGDVLVVYNGDYDSEESPSPTMKSARCLKKVATYLFGLEAEENLKGCGRYGDYQSDTQLQEMRKYQIVMLLRGSELRDGEFDAILKCCSRSSDFPNQRFVVVDAGMNAGQVLPLSVNQFEIFKLEDIGGLGDVPQVPGEESDQLPVVDIINHIFHGDVDAIMKLFCFMIGQQWPCP